MQRILPVAFVATLAVGLGAQTIDTLGGTNTTTSRAATGKASVFAVDTTTMLLDYEMFLNVPGPEALTFYLYRHHSRSGTFTLEWQTTTNVNGTGVGAAWYGTGPIPVPLVAGNYYMLGAMWNGTVTYHYSSSSQPVPISFGSWQRAHTLTTPLPPTYNVAAGIDSACYHQRLTSIPVGAVVPVGSGCGATTPRLVADSLFTVGTTPNLELVDAPVSTLAVFTFAVAPTLSAPIPFLGCSLWLNVAAPTASIISTTSGTGVATLPFTLPANQALVGTSFATQAGALSTPTSLSNAIDLTIN